MKKKILTAVMVAAVILGAFGAGYYVRGIYDARRLKDIPVSLPSAAVSADIAAEKVEEIANEIRAERSGRKEVIRDAHQVAIAGVDGLDDHAVADRWNQRLGEFRESETATCRDDSQ